MASSQEVQRIYLSVNTNKTDSSAGGYLRPGGTFRIMFDPDSRSSNMITSDIDADTSAADLQVGEETEAKQSGPSPPISDPNMMMLSLMKQQHEHQLKLPTQHLAVAVGASTTASPLSLQLLGRLRCERGAV